MTLSDRKRYRDTIGSVAVRSLPPSGHDRGELQFLLHASIKLRKAYQFVNCIPSQFINKADVSLLAMLKAAIIMLAVHNCMTSVTALTCRKTPTWPSKAC